MIVLVISIIVLNVLDILQTRKALRLGYREQNPIARWLFRKLNFGVVSLGRVIIVLGVSCLAYSFGLWLALIFLAIISSLPVINNFIVMRAKCY